MTTTALRYTRPSRSKSPLAPLGYAPPTALRPRGPPTGLVPVKLMSRRLRTAPCRLLARICAQLPPNIVGAWAGGC
eukprot:8174385-Lingulodinium_polyedra.AAC.1